jgi:hypothetical protein
VPDNSVPRWLLDGLHCAIIWNPRGAPRMQARNARDARPAYGQTVPGARVTPPQERRPSYTGLATRTNRAFVRYRP